MFVSEGPSSLVLPAGLDTETREGYAREVVRFGVIVESLMLGRVAGEG